MQKHEQITAVYDSGLFNDHNSVVNNLIITALNNNEQFIRKFSLIPNIAYLTLLYYQYSYLQDLSNENRKKEDIVCSYFESNYQSPHVVIMSHYEDNKRYTLRRIRLKEDIYKDLEKIYKDDEQTWVNDDLLNQFMILYEKYESRTKTLR